MLKHVYQRNYRVCKTTVQGNVTVTQGEFFKVNIRYLYHMFHLYTTSVFTLIFEIQPSVIYSFQFDSVTRSVTLLRIGWLCLSTIQYIYTYVLTHTSPVPPTLEAILLQISLLVGWLLGWLVGRLVGLVGWLQLVCLFELLFLDYCLVSKRTRFHWSFSRHEVSFVLQAVLHFVIIMLIFCFHNILIIWLNTTMLIIWLSEAQLWKHSLLTFSFLKYNIWKSTVDS